MKTTQDKIKVMQAFVDGKAVEARFREEPFPWAPSGWFDVKKDDPHWNWRELEYRVKPREWWGVSNGTTTVFYNNWDVATRCAGKFPGSEIFLVREVLDE